MFGIGRKKEYTPSQIKLYKKLYGEDVDISKIIGMPNSQFWETCEHPAALLYKAMCNISGCRSFPPATQEEKHYKEIS